MTNIRGAPLPVFKKTDVTGTENEIWPEMSLNAILSKGEWCRNLGELKETYCTQKSKFRKHSKRMQFKVNIY